MTIGITHDIIHLSVNAWPDVGESPPATLVNQGDHGAAGNASLLTGGQYNAGVMVAGINSLRGIRGAPFSYNYPVAPTDNMLHWMVMDVIGNRESGFTNTVFCDNNQTRFMSVYDNERDGSASLYAESFWYPAPSPATYAGTPFLMWILFASTGYTCANTHLGVNAVQYRTSQNIQGGTGTRFVTHASGFTNGANPNVVLHGCGTARVTFGSETKEEVAAEIEQQLNDIAAGAFGGELEGITPLPSDIPDSHISLGLAL